MKVKCVCWAERRISDLCFEQRPNTFVIRVVDVMIDRLPQKSHKPFGLVMSHMAVVCDYSPYIMLLCHIFWVRALLTTRVLLVKFWASFVLNRQSEVDRTYLESESAAGQWRCFPHCKHPTLCLLHPKPPTVTVITFSWCSCNRLMQHGAPARTSVAASLSA